MLDYKNTVALAPMVRVSDLPLRSLCLKYGADLVWGPEVVDKAIINTRRQLNEELGTVDFVSLRDPNKVIWRTAPKLEKSKLIFQLGSADASLAVKAAQMVANDVSAIDLNCGCPKHFSVHSGMGAQLLTVPDKLIGILKSLVEQVGKPFKIAISAKIRLLETAEKTYALVQRIVNTGISNLTVHCRTTPMRPREPAQYDYLKTIADICHKNGVTCIVNGDIKSRADLQTYSTEYGVDGVMIAREAQRDFSCFSKDPVDLSMEAICREFLDACVKYDYNTAHAKYNLTNFVPGKDALYAQFARSKSIPELNNFLERREWEVQKVADSLSPCATPELKTSTSASNEATNEILAETPTTDKSTIIKDLETTSATTTSATTSATTKPAYCTSTTNRLEIETVAGQKRPYESEAESDTPLKKHTGLAT